jgi:PAS domain S-box-containing protein
MMLPKQDPTEILERITDAFLALDKNWRFTFVNKNAGEILNRNPAELIGKDIWSEFPEMTRKEFHQACEKAMELQESVSLEEYYPPLEKWFENYIYPSSDGLSIYFRCITEKKLREQQLKISEERYRLLVEQASDAIFVSDIQLNILDVNTRGCQDLGYTREEILKMNTVDLLHFAPGEPPLQLDRLLAGDVVATKRSGKRKNGSPIPIELTARLLSDGRIMGIARDITERVKNEKEIIESELKFRSVIKNTSDGFVLYDMETKKVLETNSAYEKMLGYSADEMKNLSLYDIVSHEKKDIDSYNKRIRQQKFVAIGERRHRRKDGTILTVDVTVNLLTLGKRDVMSVLVRDITERIETERKIKQSEEDYRNLVEHAADGIFISTLNEEILDANTSACELTGYSREELLKLVVDDLVTIAPGETPSRADEIKSGIKILQSRNLVRKDGVIVPVEVSAKMLPDKRVLSIVRDMTGQKKSEQEILLMNEQLRELSSHLQNIREEERAFIAREIHDELGQQLTLIKMNLHSCIKKFGSLDKDLAGKATAIGKSINQTIDTVRKIASELRPVMLDDFSLAEALQIHSQEFTRRTGIPCKIGTYDTDVVSDVNINTQVFRIYQEALTNVVRHSNATKVEANLYSDNGVMHLSVKDNGHGFEIEKEPGKKTLGLVMMRERAIGIGGTLAVTSQLGEGTSVDFSLDLKK